ncbi:MAG: trigger factor [Methylobacteriaceae bacterium]|nr:trigger factor [Methylobacteriaceae bacterium]
MQVTETLSQGLKREFKVILPAEELGARLDGQIAELKDKVRLNGFRPGKVPVSHLKRVYGRSVMAEVVQNAVTEANRKIVEDNSLRLALEPKVNFSEDQAEVERALEAKGDLAFTVALEVLPRIEAGTFDDIELERPVAPVANAEVEQAVERLISQSRTYSPRTGDAAAETGDRVTIDFAGTIGGNAFEGGTGTDVEVVLGSKSFLPGFEDQLLGIRAGETRTVKATFPEGYVNASLSGREAEFTVTAKTVAAPDVVALDDQFAKAYGFDSLDLLKQALRQNLEKEHARLARDKLKRRLLDALDQRYRFDLPQGLVDQEFANIWAQIEAEQQQTKRTFADEGTSEEAARAEYRAIAERRVRLGLVLAEVGEKAGVQVAEQEVTQALVERARAFPGQEKKVWEYYRKNPQALAELRAPLFEEKVVDHILGIAKVADKPVTREELFTADEEAGSAPTPAPAALPESAAETTPKPAAPPPEGV